MATYIHNKMVKNNTRGHRRWGHHSGVVGKENNDNDRPRRAARNGGKYFVRFVDGLRSRFRAEIVATDNPGGDRQRKQTTAERLIAFRTLFGAPKGMSHDGLQIERTNISVGDKSFIRKT